MKTMARDGGYIILESDLGVSWKNIYRGYTFLPVGLRSARMSEIRQFHKNKTESEVLGIVSLKIENGKDRRKLLLMDGGGIHRLDEARKELSHWGKAVFDNKMARFLLTRDAEMWIKYYDSGFLTPHWLEAYMEKRFERAA